MGIFDSLRKRTSAVRFSYSFQLQSLSPWPANNGKAIAVAWQRGSKKKKRGVTEAHIPTQVPGQLGTIIHLNEVIQLSATLYMDGNMEPSPEGPFKKKCLILAVIENGVHHRDTNALGRVVIDLSEFASLQSEVQKEFAVACSRNVLAAVGEPLLTMTVRCAWKSSGGPASMASSMSSDRTGGTFNTNFNAFVRGAENERIPIPLTGEQFEDLRGFDRLNTITECDDQSLPDPGASSHQLSPNNRTRKSTYDSEGILNDDDDDQIHQIPVSLPDEDQASDQVLQEDVEIEKLRDEFCFGGSGDSMDDAEREEGVNVQDRTSSWLAGLSLKPESPTIGLIDENTGPVKIEDVKTPQSQDHSSHETPEDDRRSDKSLKLIVETSSEASEVESIVEKQILVDSEFEPQFQDHNDDLTTKSDPPSKQQDVIQIKSKAFERRWKRATNPKEDLTPTTSSSSSCQDQTKTVSLQTTTTTAFHAPLHLEVKAATTASITNQDTIPHKRSFLTHREGPPLTHASSSLIIEVQTAAFMEYAIYLARPSPQKYTSRNIHAPAKRIIQGLLLNGITTHESLNLLQNCLQSIKIMIDGCSMDVPGMSFWWSNCFQLRLLLTNHCASIVSWAPQSGGEVAQNSIMDSINDNQQWEFRRMLQNVLKMEKSIFDRLQQYLWWKVMIPMILKMTPGTPFAKLNTAASSLTHHQCNESGVQVWLSALTRVYEEFQIRPSKAPGDQGHLLLLRQKLIFNYCRLMDCMLFKELLSSAFHPNGGNGHSGGETLDPWDSFRDDNLISQSLSWPKLNPSVLPFKPGPLTFGVGMHLKMAVTQWSEWILLESKFKTHHVQSGDPGQSFFPLLKASADVLMMPKELLTDSAVRGELFSALSLKSLCVLLEKFQPDEFAPDPVDPEVLRSLTERLQDSPDSVGEPMTSPKLLEPPFEAALDLEETDYDHHDDHEDQIFDSESEIALEALMKAIPSIDNSISRFEILKNQWRQNLKR